MQACNKAFVLYILLGIVTSCYGQGQTINYNEANDIQCSVPNACVWQNPMLWLGGNVPVAGDSVQIYSLQDVFILVNNSVLELTQLLVQGEASLSIFNSVVNIQDDIQLSNNGSIVVSNYSEIHANSIFSLDSASISCSGGSQILSNVESLSQSNIDLQNCEYSGEMRTTYITAQSSSFDPAFPFTLNINGLGFFLDAGALSLNINMEERAQLHINADIYQGVISLDDSSIVSGNIPGSDITINAPGPSAQFVTTSDNITITLGNMQYAPLLSFPSASSVSINGPGSVALSLYENVVLTLSNVTLVDVNQADPTASIIMTYIETLDIFDADFNFSGRIVAMDETPINLNNANVSVYNNGKVSMQFNDLFMNFSTIFSDSPIIMENILISDAIISAPYVIGNFIQVVGPTAFSNSSVSVEDIYFSANFIQADGSLEVGGTATFERINGQFPDVLVTTMSIGGTLVVEGINTLADLAAYPNNQVLLMSTEYLNADDGGKYPSLHMNVAMNSEINVYDFSLDYDPLGFGLFLKWTAKTTPTPAPTPAPKRHSQGWIAAPVIIPIAIIGGVAFYYFYYRKRQGYSAVPQ